jgi:hypothetical protein
VKERLVDLKQNFAHVGNLSKKLATGEKTKPLSSQKVGFESKQPGVIGLGYLIMPSRMGIC